MNLPSYDLRETLNVKPILDMYINDGSITEFDEDLIWKIKHTNVLMLRDFFQIFEEGLNIGTCGMTSRYLSYLFNKFTIVEKGVCKILKGTKGAPDGDHAWLVVDGYVYDTTLMLKIEQDIAYNVLGYIPYKEVTSKEVMKDTVYIMQKEIALDLSNLKWKMDLIQELEKFNLRSSLIDIV